MMPAPAPAPALLGLALLAQAGGNMLPVFGWSLVLICLLVAGFFAVSKLRQWLKEDDVPGPAIGFTLSDLRQLHKQGKMSDEEFERARSLIVGNAKAMSAKLPDPLARGGKRPPA